MEVLSRGRMCGITEQLGNPKSKWELEINPRVRPGISWVRSWIFIYGIVGVGRIFKDPLIPTSPSMNLSLRKSPSPGMLFSFSSFEDPKNRKEMKGRGNPGGFLGKVQKARACGSLEC